MDGRFYTVLYIQLHVEAVHYIFYCFGVLVQYQPADRYIVHQLTIAVHDKYHIGGGRVGIKAAQVLYGLADRPLLSYGSKVGIDQARHALLRVAQQVVGGQAVLIIQQVQEFRYLHPVQRIKECYTVVRLQVVQYVRYPRPWQLFYHPGLQHMVQEREYLYLYRFGER